MTRSDRKSESQSALRTDLNPADFPIGSLESRAVARALTQKQDKEEDFIQIVYVSPNGSRENGPLIRIGEK